MVTVDGLPAQSAVDQVLSTTRCVRKGLDTTREVPRELIEDCLRVAMHAPIGSNGLYPHFMVVTDPAKRAAVAGFYKQAWDAYLPLPFSAANLHFDDPVHEAQQAPVVSSAAYLAEHMAEVPALVIPCISPRADGMPMWVQACIWGSVLPQSWGFMLAARARTGLGLDADPPPVRGRGGGGPGHQSRRGTAGGADPGGVSASGGFQARLS